MNKRITKLRLQSLNAIPKLSIERAQLITEFYEKHDLKNVSIPVARALAFKHLLEHKIIYINDDELIVGERGPAPKETSTFPEICCHNLTDLRILNSRKKIFYKVDEEGIKFTKEKLIPYWKGRSLRDRIFSEVNQEWLNAYKAGIFTEFMEQRAPGHTVAGNKIFKKGFNDFKKEIITTIKNLDFKKDKDAKNKKEQLEAMAIAADAIIIYAKRHAEHLKTLQNEEKNIKRKNELEKMIKICDTVPGHAPRTFHEALQHYWFIHLGVIAELNTWDSFNPGRLDQHLYHFYKKEIENGSLTQEKAKELLQAFWIKFNNQLAPPKVGVTAEESNTYTDFCLINLGGVTENGDDGVNELSYLILDVIEEMKIVQPSSMIQVSSKTPEDFIHRALQIVKTGFGQPSIFNTDVIIQEMVRTGKSIIDARNGGASGCVETGAFGKESYILTGYFNLVKILELTLYNGHDPRTGKKIGLQTGDPTIFTSFKDLFKAYTKQLNYFIDIKIKGNNIIEKLWSMYLPAPFLSLIIDHCIITGRDYNSGGAKYNTSYIQGVGLGSITDSLTSIKYNVFDKKYCTMFELLQILKNNYKNNEELRQKFIYETPKYGNDDDYADKIAKDVFDIFFNAVDGRPNTKGGYHRINLLPTTVHIYFGSVLGATPDGRKALEPLSEGISPVQGMDINGPTAVLKSASKIDHIRTGGTLLNQKFTPSFFATDKGIQNITHLIRAYFKMGGHHIQYNVVSVETLKEAQRHPEKYRDLIVRVAGYSDYFVNLGIKLQNEIIQRTEHGKNRYDSKHQ